MTKSMKNYKILDEKYDFLKKGGNFPAIVHGKMGKYAQLNQSKKGSKKLHKNNVVLQTTNTIKTCGNTGKTKSKIRKKMSKKSVKKEGKYARNNANNKILSQKC